jgi:hypothetical protein
MKCVDKCPINYYKTKKKECEISDCIERDIDENILLIHENEYEEFIGNNSCDMDSVLSSYLLSLGKNIKYNTIIYNKSNDTAISNKQAKSLFLPVLNIKRGTFYQRLDEKYVFDFFKIDENLFWYISDEIFEEKNLFSFHKNNNIKTNIRLLF